MRTRFIACLMVTTMVATSLPNLSSRSGGRASAQTMDADTKEAKSLFEDGVKLYKTGKYEEARVKFKAAYGLKKRPSITINLANAELQTKRPIDALAHFREVLAMSDAKAEDKEEARNGIVEARKHVGVVTIDAPAGAS